MLFIKAHFMGVNPKTGMKDWPKEDVVIESIELFKKK